MKKPIKNILILSATGQYNIGDEIIVREEYNVLRKKYPDATIKVFTYNPESSLLPEGDDLLEYYPFFPNNIKKHPFKNFDNFIQNMGAFFTADLVVIGGGGLLYEKSTEGPNKCLWLWKARIGLLKLLKKTIKYCSLGVHLTDEDINKGLWMFKGENVSVSVRDTHTAGILEEKGIFAQYIPDPACLYPVTSRNTGSKRIGLALRAGFLPNEQEDIAKMIEFLQKKGLEPVLICHSYHQDSEWSNDYVYMEELANRYGVSITTNLEDTIEVYKYLDYVVCMRFHSHLLALAHGVPFVSLSYSLKTDVLLEDLKYPHALDAEVFDMKDFEKQLIEVVNDADAISLKISEKYDTLQKETRKKLVDFL